ncbi:hypothetical protein EJ04DRAFT_528769 [Polyplosphaeria fusca]|uniref:Uncharacterized protein n=1 Tax=Polyplosphaeria fusca TaxID=682080 RepID=A0A9P4UWU4_9PLEO|nr:hypothetical protein EJ04DRAFT_528769 [Polyplosphaeria fusca]
MSQDSLRRLVNTPRRSPRISTPQISPSRASPSPIGPPLRRRTDRRRPITILSDNEDPAPEVIDASGSSQSHTALQQGLQQARKKPRISQFDYSWVVDARIPGYIADERQTRRTSGYWLYGVPLVRRDDGTHWYLCKVCHLQVPPKYNAILRINGGGSVLHHLCARHPEQYSHVKSLQVKAARKTKAYCPSLLHWTIRILYNKLFIVKL